ncbi:hypothetical protein C471_07636 [Halorubrum saccharovorum DSM 1137]|uniref:Pyrrolo-quinoline quinone repeat domain-containing protein n=2 Tax=Halorubrum saccharovorum TaxID=2248 RepID=M0E114_9EURY|nr:hypothetical protein C471_07636 [Halorubrum saccharovorum DSM 1137]
MVASGFAAAPASAAPEDDNKTAQWTTAADWITTVESNSDTVVTVRDTGDLSSSIVAYDSTGSEKWSRAESDYINDDIAVSDSYVYYGTANNTAVLRDVDTGDLVWSDSRDRDWVGTPAINEDAGMVYNTETREFLGHDINTGETEFVTRPTSASEMNLITSPVNGEMWVVTPGFSGGTALTSIDPATGKSVERSTFSTAVGVASGATDHHDGDFYIEDSGSLAELTPETGESKRIDVDGVDFSTGGYSVGPTGDVLTEVTDDQDAVIVDPDTSEVTDEYPTGTDTPNNYEYADVSGDGEASVFVGTTGSTGELSRWGAPTPNGVSGKVVNQDGDPVADTHVSVYATNVSHPDIADAQDALDYTEEISGVNVSRIGIPDNYDLKGALESADTTMPMVHDTAAWHDPDAGGVDVAPGSDLAEPSFRVEAGETHTVSLWDPSEESMGLLSDPYDRNLPATTTGGTVTVERFGATGSVVDSWEQDTSPSYSAVGREKEHETLRLTLKAGIYRIDAHDGGEAWVVAGDGLSAEDSVDDIPGTDLGFSDSLGDSDREQEIKDAVNDSKLTRLHAKTNSDGEFRFGDLPQNYEAVAVTAYGAETDMIEQSTDVPDAVTDPSLGEFRSAYKDVDDAGGIPESGLSVVVQSEQVTTSVPNQNVVVPVTEMNSPGIETLGVAMSRLDSLRDLLDSEDYSNLNDVLGNTPDLSQEEVEERIDAVTDVIDNGGDDGDDSGVNVPEPGWNTDDGPDVDVDTGDNPSVTVTVPFAGSLVMEHTTVIAEFSNGDSAVLNESDYRIESGLLGNDKVVIEDYELPDDAEGVEFDVLASDGGVDSGAENTTESVEEAADFGREKVQVQNPGSDGELPGIAAFAVSDSQPTPGDDIEVRVVPEDDDDSYLGVANASVTAPNGTEIPTSAAGDLVTAPVSSAGEHHVSMQIETPTGSVTESISVGAVESPVPVPPSVRVESGPSGYYGVAADGAEHGAVTVTGAETDIEIDAADATRPLHVYATDLPVTQDITIDATDAEGEPVSQTAPIKLHTSELPAEAHVRAHGEPIEIDGSENAAGVRKNTGDGTLIETRMQDGSADVSVVTSPSIFEEIEWWWDTSNPLTGIPVLQSGAVGVGGVSA